MTASALTGLVGSGGWTNIINYEIAAGNEIWRFALVLLVILVVLAAGKIAQFALVNYSERLEKKLGISILTLFLKCLAKPITLIAFSVGLYLCKLCVVFEDTSVTPARPGISSVVENIWTQTAKAIGALAVAYFIYRLVDIIEYYLLRWTSKTQTKLDDMLVPVVRKAMRVTIAIVAVIFIVDNVFDQDVKSILVGAGVGGIAVALAAKETIANFFGSITIFADRPFQIDELVKIDGHFGPVEDVGFRSTRVRTLEGHLITIPNSIVANSIVENVGRRPFIRRTSNITITYDSGHTKAKKAVEIIKDILANVPEVNADSDKPPRVYFNEFNDCSLNIYMSYWVKPPDYWLYYEVNQRINLEMMKRFEAEKIEFAFPTQTLYVKKD